MSSSRRAGFSLTLLGEAEQLVRGVAHGGDHHHHVSPGGPGRATRSATFRIRSTSATDEPPYFCTTIDTGALPLSILCGRAPRPAAESVELAAQVEPDEPVVSWLVSCQRRVGGPEAVREVDLEGVPAHCLFEAKRNEVFGFTAARGSAVIARVVAPEMGRFLHSAPGLAQPRPRWSRPPSPRRNASSSLTAFERLDRVPHVRGGRGRERRAGRTCARQWRRAQARSLPRLKLSRPSTAPWKAQAQRAIPLLEEVLLDRELDRAVVRAVDRELRAREEAEAQAQSDLGAGVEAEEVVARPIPKSPSPRGRENRWVRRKVMASDEARAGSWEGSRPRNRAARDRLHGRRELRLPRPGSWHAGAGCVAVSASGAPAGCSCPKAGPMAKRRAPRAAPVSSTRARLNGRPAASPRGAAFMLRCPVPAILRTPDHERPGLAGHEARCSRGRRPWGSSPSP